VGGNERRARTCDEGERGSLSFSASFLAKVGSHVFVQGYFVEEWPLWSRESSLPFEL